MNEKIGRFVATYLVRTMGKEDHYDIALEFRGSTQFLPFAALTELRKHFDTCGAYLLNVTTIPDIGNEWKNIQEYTDYSSVINV
jgi:hypothetical protein